MQEDSIDAAVEGWLKELIVVKKFPPEALAAAMVEDGYAAGEAHTLAAAAYVRYGTERVVDLTKTDTGRVVLDLLGSNAAAAVFESYPRRHAEQPFDPWDCNKNCIRLSDRTVYPQFIGRHPRVAVFGNVLSDEECAALIELGKSRLRADTVIDKISGASISNATTRSSYGAFLRHDESDLLKRVTQRVAELVCWPVARHEDIALSHYLEGQQFLPHWDYFNTQGSNIDELLHAGQRIATLVIYLNEVQAGGGTVFPQSGYEIRPQRGCGTYFTYQRPDGSPDPLSLHGGNPIIEGEKWIATFWFVERDIDRTSSTEYEKTA